MPFSCHAKKERANHIKPKELKAKKKKRKQTRAQRNKNKMKINTTKKQ
jgi:hypothetical protein